MFIYRVSGPSYCLATVKKANMAESVTSTVTTVDNQEDSFINVSSHEIFLLLEDT